jgi:hypothetical protein
MMEETPRVGVNMANDDRKVRLTTRSRGEPVLVRLDELVRDRFDAHLAERFPTPEDCRTPE